MPNPGSQGSHRRPLAVKHLDGEPLSRVDLQYDFLSYLFADTQTVFTDPFQTIHGSPAGTKVTFRDLYVNCIAQSPRCSKVTKEKLIDNHLFGDEFAKISLLSNVGRINTTMAFFPEMRTSLRTYHPVPSLQKSDGNLQDAPRIKNILKACLLPTEQPNEPLTPADVLAKSRSGQIPPTTIVNLIFVFAANSSIIAQSHFAGQINNDLLDFFTPLNVSSESRARAFLWLCYHYLEGPHPNPFSDEFSSANPSTIPKLHVLSAEESLLENVDPLEEKEWGERMTVQRRDFMANKNKVPEQGEEGMFDAKSGDTRKGGKGKGGKKTKGSRKDALLMTSRDILSKHTAADDETFSNVHDELISEASGHVSQLSAMSPGRSPGSGTQMSLSHIRSPEKEAVGEQGILPVSPPPDESTSVGRPFLAPRLPRPAAPQSILRNPREAVDPYPRPTSPSLNAVDAASNGKPIRTRTRKSRQIRILPPRAPREEAARPPVPVPRRSTLEQAFHFIMNTDPLEDSADEEEKDENTRADLLLRLRIISRLRGREPTPEPEPELPPHRYADFIHH